MNDAINQNYSNLYGKFVINSDFMFDNSHNFQKQFLVTGKMNFKLDEVFVSKLAATHVSDYNIFYCSMHENDLKYKHFLHFFFIHHRTKMRFFMDVCFSPKLLSFYCFYHCLLLTMNHIQFHLPTEKLINKCSFDLNLFMLSQQG